MTKFVKKVQKIVKITESALVVGTGFCHLEDILMAFNTVVLVNNNRPNTKSKNLVYRENFDNLNLFTQVSAVFFDLDQLDKLDILKHFWQRNNSYVIIEGSEPISREFSKPLYATGWGCTIVEKGFHVWEKLK